MPVLNRFLRQQAEHGAIEFKERGRGEEGEG